MLRLAIAAAAAVVAGCAGAGPPSAAPPAVMAGLGQRTIVGGVGVTPLRVVEDSRCPSGVQCIWAGRVRVAVRLRERGAGREAILTLREPLRIGAGWLVLCAVRPDRGRAGPVPGGDYRFRFALGRDAPPDCAAGG